MSDVYFSTSRLPRFRTGSSGHAMPRPGVTVAACRVPMCVTMTTPWGQVLAADPAKHWHLCLDAARGDHYPNDEFEAYYVLNHRLDPTNDPRAKFLVDFWMARGHAVTVRVYEAQKIKPLLVVGVCDESGVFENLEGTAPFEPGDIVAQSPDIPGRMWIIKFATFRAKYDDQGIRPGTPAAA